MNLIYWEMTLQNTQMHKEACIGVFPPEVTSRNNL